MGEAILTALVTLVLGCLGMVVELEFLGGWVEFGVLVAVCVMGTFIIYFNEKRSKISIFQAVVKPYRNEKTHSYNLYREQCVHLQSKSRRKRRATSETPRCGSVRGTSFSVSRRKLTEVCLTSLIDAVFS